MSNNDGMAEQIKLPATPPYVISSDEEILEEVKYIYPFVSNLNKQLPPYGFIGERKWTQNNEGIDFLWLSRSEIDDQMRTWLFLDPLKAQQRKLGIVKIAQALTGKHLVLYECLPGTELQDRCHHNFRLHSSDCETYFYSCARRGVNLKKFYEAMRGLDQPPLMFNRFGYQQPKGLLGQHGNNHLQPYLGHLDQSKTKELLDINRTMLGRLDNLDQKVDNLIEDQETRKNILAILTNKNQEVEDEAPRSPPQLHMFGDNGMKDISAPGTPVFEQETLGADTRKQVNYNRRPLETLQPDYGTPKRRRSHNGTSGACRIFRSAPNFGQ